MWLHALGLLQGLEMLLFPKVLLEGGEPYLFACNKWEVLKCNYLGACYLLKYHSLKYKTTDQLASLNDLFPKSFSIKGIIFLLLYFCGGRQTWACSGLTYCSVIILILAGLWDQRGYLGSNPGQSGTKQVSYLLYYGLSLFQVSFLLSTPTILPAFPRAFQSSTNG